MQKFPIFLLFSSVVNFIFASSGICKRFWFNVEVVSLTEFQIFDLFICLIFICAFSFGVIIPGNKDITVQTFKVSEADGLFE